MIRRVLIANRGEIAVRVVRACRELGLEAIAICSEAEATALHAVIADRAVCVGPAPAVESYLAIDAVIAAARATGADAVHPGYGFLAENPAFAAACADAGLVFVGPPADAIARMGSKIEARRLMQAAGVPVVPGRTPSNQSAAGLTAAAAEVGFPLLLKAAAGGGGKGMRVVRTPDALPEAVEGARREALAAFADGTLYVERLLDAPRHIEIQVFADALGTTVHLFERECSVQRRHQKVIEETPSPALTPALRHAMGAAAVRAAETVGYRNAGTVEFLLDGEGDDARFYFLEMNTRLQVEHPVTEVVTGVDLVRAQFAVADGQPLPWRQEDLRQQGHAIECRVYAEDPAAGFLPAAGRVLRYREPGGPGIRVDSGIVEGSDVPVHYDPLLAKLVASAATREAAIARARAALRGFPILGVRTNLTFLLRVLEHEAFVAGRVDTGWVERELPTLLSDAPGRTRQLAAAAAAALTPAGAPGHAPAGNAPGAADPWTALAGWRRPA